MKRRKIFLFPRPNKHSEGNRYIYYFAKALSAKNEVVNLNQKRDSKLKFLKHFFDADTFILNWTESLVFHPHKKIRIPIVIAYLFGITLSKLCRKKIIWVFHNKHSHNGRNWASHLLLVFNSFISDLVITHASEGVSYCKKHYYHKANIIFHPHPVYPEAIPLNCEEIYDIIIWGDIRRAKSILEFLQYWNHTTASEKYKILICGQCIDDAYNQEILKQLTPNIHYLNELIKTADLNKYLSSSKHILFTHNYSSVLCSGSLLYSLSFRKNIIAPRIGAFNDFAKMGLVSAYDRFDEIPELLNKQPKSHSKELDDFLAGNTWENFAAVLEKVFEQL
ncbi:MAG: hypothetical protein LBU03_06385 [Tannerellaceae bacterium]|jgi:hypothetical protein|nr:hypothetical protein [Tannerellaceae bacterium]